MSINRQASRAFGHRSRSYRILLLLSFCLCLSAAGDWFDESGNRRDGLVAGAARFEKPYHQGTQPIPALHYSGLTSQTMLVVEAVDALCPFQGVISATARPA